jgi:cholinesterase
LRWAPPQPFSGDTTINAAEFVCPHYAPTRTALTDLKGFSCPARTGLTANSTTDTPPDLSITPQGAEILLSFLAQIDDRFGEDCLTLNVWTKPQTGEAKKAVMLWIYGGGYSTGATDISAYNGKYLADEEDVVIVSVK